MKAAETVTGRTYRYTAAETHTVALKIFFAEIKI
jgi:hypothetical protein